MKAFLITTTCLVGLLFASFLIQQPTRKKYDEATEWNQSTDKHVVSEAGPEAVSFFDDVRSTWYRMEARSGSIVSDAELEGLKLAGFEATVKGIADLNSYTTPPYSYFNHERNKRALVATALKNIAFILGGDGNSYYSKDWIYFRSSHRRSPETITSYESYEDGIHAYRYISELPKSPERYDYLIFTPMPAAKKVAKETAPPDR